MKIQTFSVVVGGKKCNATCPYCVSKMTGKEECTEEINERNFHKACEFAQMSGVSTVLLTGKGEPTLYMSHISRYLELINKYSFPFIELQTNGIDLKEHPHAMKPWYDKGLTIVSLSCVHWDTEKNKEILGKNFVALEENIKLLHSYGFSVRVSCVMLNGRIDSIHQIKTFIDMCKSWEVEQFTIRPVSNDVKINEADIFNNTKKYEIYNWIKEREIDNNRIYDIDKFFNTDKDSTLLLELAHGAKVYDYCGQNISINSCLTHSPNPDEVRQLIFFPDGKLRYSWVYPGAIII